MNGTSVSKHYALTATDRVDVDIPVETVERALLAAEPTVLFEDSDIVVINKPAGVLVHATESSNEDTLADWICKRAASVEGVGEDARRPGIVHRLDRDVSGVMVIAKTQAAFDHLKRQFAERTVEKEYTALVHGVMLQPDGEIRFSIDRSVRDGKIAAKSDQSGKQAITRFWVEKRFQQYTLLKVQILTGRTNQIRVHLRARSHPIVGDTRYGRGHMPEPLGRPFLHAKRLAFLNMAGEKVEWTTPLPADLEAFLKTLT